MAEDAKVITLSCSGSVPNELWTIEGPGTSCNALVTELNSAFSTTLSCKGMGHKVKVVIVTPQD